jgi:hypothetical protein
MSVEFEQGSGKGRRISRGDVPYEEYFPAEHAVQLDDAARNVRVSL